MDGTRSTRPAYYLGSKITNLLVTVVGSLLYAVILLALALCGVFILLTVIPCNYLHDCLNRLLDKEVTKPKEKPFTITRTSTTGIHPLLSFRDPGVEQQLAVYDLAERKRKEDLKRRLSGNNWRH